MIRALRSSWRKRGNWRANANPLRWSLVLVSSVLIVTALLAACAEPMRPPSRAAAVAATPAPGEVQRGWQLIQDYGCHTCHTIPGVPAANALVGPPLTDWADRHYIVGMIPNTPENVSTFIQHPQSFRPGTAMPDMGVTSEDARAISAYLYTLRRDRVWNPLELMGWRLW
ncbi:MAG: cytochrome c class I [Chloroflexi bacterium]|nr:MAG: cytochrome c class I [Chloroflexota bacterium]